MKDLIVNEQPESADMERAKRAVKRFRAMLPGLNGYVRAISGNKNLRIELSSGPPRTDGRKIMMEPPIQLGDDLTHERMLCDKRDPVTSKQKCYGCAVREDMLIKIYHEIAHNVYGTFDMKVRGMDLKRKVYEEINKLEPRRAKVLQDKLWTLSPPPNSYLELAGHVNEFLPILVNALEDLRVDEAMFKARRGTRAMFYAMTRTTFVDGIDRLDGSVAQWKDMPLNHQALIGVFVAGCKYDFTGWFHPKVEAALRDDVIQTLVKDVDELKSALETFERAFPLLERLRELGFCLTEEEYDEKEQEQQDEAGSEDSDDSGEEGGDSGSDRGSESSLQAPDQEGDGAPSEQGESQASDRDDEEASPDGSDLEDAAQPESGAPSEVPAEPGAEGSDDEVADEGDDDSGLGSDGDPSDQSELGSGDESGAPEDEDGPEEDGSGGRSGEGSSSEPDDGTDSEEAAPSSDVDELTDEEGSSDRSDQQEDGGSDSPIDSGADEGLGGIPLKEAYGNSDGLEDVIESITKHGDHTESATIEQNISERTIVQSLYFEKESGTVSTVHEHFYGDGCTTDAWTRAEGDSTQARRRRGTEVGEFAVGEDILGPALLHMRRVFADNARAHMEPNLRSGRVNARVLGKRAPMHDPRLFHKKRTPGKRSYAVLIGIDISGSTIGVNIMLAKLAAYAQAELCSRLGIEFAVYCHSATPLGGTHSLDMYCIKDFDAPWDRKAQNALLSIGSWSENLDGHSLEYYRKKIERHPATDKMILYYTDGKMPAANYSEELAVLQREIDVCRRNRITLLGVGIRTDSPIRHGLDTVQIDGPDDVHKVVKHLESRILHNR